MRQLQRIAITPSQKQQEQIILTAEQQHYLFHVLRLEEGDKFIAMDGKGKCWLTQLIGEQARVLEELEIENQELPISTTLISALPKNVFDDVVRCCTELGVTCIVPVISKRTLLKPSPQKLKRWQKIAQEAAEQSERAFVPQILEPVSFYLGLLSLPDFQDSVTNQQKYICTARGNSPHLFTYLSGQKLSGQKLSEQKYISPRQKPGQIWIATGPEGGWTDQEIDGAIAAGFQPVSLGKRILRAVTAPIVALSIAATVLESITLKDVDVKF